MVERVGDQKEITVRDGGRNINPQLPIVGESRPKTGEENVIVFIIKKYRNLKKDRQ